MSSRLSDGALRAVPNPELGYSLFANRVDGKIVAASDHYKVLNLSVNCGILSSVLVEDTPEITAAKTNLNMSILFMSESSLVVASPDQETIYYTIDMSEVIPEGWNVRVERLTEKKPISIGVILVHPDHEEEVAEVHKITSADYREAGAVQCGQSSGYAFVYGSNVPCERNEGHIGKHQAIQEGITYEWERAGAASASPFGEFGFKNVCPHCGFVTAGSAAGVRVCFLCYFWLEQHGASGGFIVDGTHYRPGAGGFGGHIFHIKRNDGTTWSGELFCQGGIPSWMRHLLPDNAVFTEEKISN